MVVEDGGPQVEVGGAPLVEVEGGGPRGRQVVEGGGEPLVVGGEDGGGEVVILASLKCFLVDGKCLKCLLSCGSSLEINLYKKSIGRKRVYELVLGTLATNFIWCPSSSSLTKVGQL